MAAISDGLKGSSVGAAGWFGRPTAVPPSPPQSLGRSSQPRPNDAGGIGRFGDLGRLWEARGRAWAEAVRIHQLDRRLSRLADRVSENWDQLERFKLYPPYPLDEPRRAQAIRQFNGLAAEARRLVDADFSPAALGENATTAEAEAAVTALGRLDGRVASQRVDLATKLSAEAEAPEAEVVSSEIGHRFEKSPDARLARAPGDALRQIA